MDIVDHSTPSPFADPESDSFRCRSGTLWPVSPRKTWLDGRVDVFLDESRHLGLTCSRDPVRHEIEMRVSAVAATLRVSEATAQREFDDHTIREMARRMSTVLEAEKPGSDLLTLPPTHTVPTAIAGRTSAGLAIVAELAATADLPNLDENAADTMHQAIALICTWGIMTERSSSLPGMVAVPEALIHRTIRELARGIHRLDSGTVPYDGGDPDELRAALEDNIRQLRNEV
ncbi:hypothetical protein HLB23_28790 [Nocardia uniformis]|uniref:Uncharacterized protein n=1 Tax=Nocardia uniformis TaxID=53432 RepID=A0A849C530_9NOCA|nr:hypothetical protein [Nocardia uniformis]NNH73804.1 hypothetical protein [Nocardia uniformis]